MKTFFLFMFSFLFLSSGILLAQPVEIPYHFEPYELESGFYNGSNQAGNTVQVFSSIVRIDDFPWMGLHFSKANLGRESYLIITSLKDGYWQRLDAVSIEQWNNYSAFFNGDAVEIQLFAAPFDNNIFVNIDEITVGDWASGSPYNSICGPTDDRISSNQPATGRLMSIGCTAWIIPNGKFVSAGHCLDGSSGNIMEFQVPPSLPNGTVQHPGPEDQYSVDLSSKIWTNGGVGNDWGVFEVFPNSVTGLMPKEAQGAFWPLMQDLGPDSIRITGYGVDDGVANQTQQTHIGPNAGSSGTTMRYVTDTQGGNSGSPVINGLTNVAVGVHTHGGCNSSGGNNNGTSTFHAAFWAAVDMGAGGCPVEAATNPNPATSTTGVSINLTELSWTNGAGAVTNELYFGPTPGSLVLVQSGTLATSWTITGGPLEYSTTYYWQVVEIGDTCNTNGSVWSFTTELDPNIVVLFEDDFEVGSGNWNITNDGGTCVWEIFLPTYPNSYTLPATSSGGVLAADSDECGSGTTFLSTATIVPILDLSSYTGEIWIEFDNDWNVIDAQDEAHVEVSTDGGSTWIGVWDQIGVDISNTHEAIDVTALLGGQSNVSVRVRSVQPGWDWWWVLDNFIVYGKYLLPAELTSFTPSAISDSQIDIAFTPNASNNNVVIAWNLTGTFTVPSGLPPSLGQPFAGGTLLYNGTTSPVTHTGLSELTTYYYKAFSYDNINYSTGIEVNATTLETTATFQLTVSVVDGWNMVSIPGLHPTDQNVATWWPNLTGTVWGFDGTAYVPTTTTTPGAGYWMKNTVGETYNYTDIQIVPHNSIPAVSGWNIIGPYETSVATSGLTTLNPPNNLTGTVWGFDGTVYVNVDASTLEPGYGYWVKTLSACDIVIPEVLAKGSGEVVEYFKEDWGKIILTDAAGISYTLYAVKGEVDLDQYEMPPMPPAGMFDIRFSSGRIAEDINSSMQTIDMSGITYPLTVRVEGMDIRVQDESGKQIDENVKSGDQITISNTQINKLMVSGELIPDVYALEQNYPNPFNPSTVIEFSLPEDVSNVKLTIYDALGQKVAQLVNTSLKAGKYTYQWDAGTVATGMYIYELRANKFVSVKKMILVK